MNRLIEALFYVVVVLPVGVVVGAFVMRVAIRWVNNWFCWGRTEPPGPITDPPGDPTPLPASPPAIRVPEFGDAAWIRFVAFGISTLAFITTGFLLAGLMGDDFDRDRFTTVLNGYRVVEGFLVWVLVYRVMLPTTIKRAVGLILVEVVIFIVFVGFPLGVLLNCMGVPVDAVFR